MSTLADVYADEAVRAFGRAYRRALRDERVQDYASLIELENAETAEALGEAIRRFLRRNFRHAQEQGWFWPGEKDLERVMALAQQYGAAPVRAAIESYSLVWEPRASGTERKEE